MYSPKINEQHIPTLYHLGKKLKKPMTKLVNEAIAQYLEREVGIQTIDSARKNPVKRRSICDVNVVPGG